MPQFHYHLPRNKAEVFKKEPHNILSNSLLMYHTESKSISHLIPLISASVLYREKKSLKWHCLLFAKNFFISIYSKILSTCKYFSIFVNIFQLITYHNNSEAAILYLEQMSSVIFFIFSTGQCFFPKIMQFHTMMRNSLSF